MKASEKRREATSTAKAFLVELVLYGALVVAYFFLVLHFLGGWLHDLQAHHTRVYAPVAIVLIVSQAVLLESLTTFLLRLLRGGRSE